MWPFVRQGSGLVMEGEVRPGCGGMQYLEAPNMQVLSRQRKLQWRWNRGSRAGASCTSVVSHSLCWVVRWRTQKPLMWGGAAQVGKAGKNGIRRQSCSVAALANEGYPSSEDYLV